MQASRVLDDPCTAVPDSDPTDAALVCRAQNGESNAFGILWVRYASGIRAVMNRFAYQPADAEDLTQDVFLRAFQGIHGFRGESRFYTWLYRIAINTGISFRTSGCRPEWSNNDVAEQVVQVGPEGEAIGLETERAAEAAISNLSPALRHALVLNTVRGFDYQAVSALIDCPVGTVRSRISRARQALSVTLLN